MPVSVIVPTYNERENIAGMTDQTEAGPEQSAKETPVKDAKSEKRPTWGAVYPAAH